MKGNVWYGQITITAAQDIQHLLAYSMETIVQVRLNSENLRISYSPFLELSEVKNGTRQDYSVVNVDTCGEQDGKSTAQIQVNKTGLVTFSNRGGNKSECRLNKGFKVGSWCSAVDSGVLYPAQVTSSLASNLSSSPTYTPIANSSSNLSVADMFSWILNFNASEPLE